MNTIFYIFIFIIGIVFGSFYTLAVYRIPRTEDITHTHSYCPNCGHKLGFWDLIPMLSYVFLGAKCRYCKQKIRPRYFILEAISGLFFVLLAYLTNFNLENLTIYKILDFSFLVLYFTFIVLMAGIDKENRKIEKGVVAYGIIISIIYMIYLYIIDQTSIYRYGIYLLGYAIALILDNITLKKHAKNSYVYGIMFVIFTMGIFTGEFITYECIITVLLAIAIYILIHKIVNRKRIIKQQINEKFQIGYTLGLANISFFIFVLSCNKFLL